MKSATAAILCSIVFSGVAFGMEVKPSNISMPSPGGTFSFDFIVTSPPSQAAQSIQLTLGSVSGPSTLVFNSTASKAVSADSGYWVYGNSAGTEAFPSGSSYVFGDGANSPTSAVIDAGDKIARFAFTWDGTPGSYLFTINNSITNTFVFLDDFSSEAVTLSEGTSPYSFSVNIPEPVSLILLGLGGLAILRKRSK